MGLNRHAPNINSFKPTPLRGAAALCVSRNGRKSLPVITSEEGAMKMLIKLVSLVRVAVAGALSMAVLGLTFPFANALAQDGPQAVTPDEAVPVFVFAGQSNAVGVDTTNELRTDQLAPQLN